MDVQFSCQKCGQHIDAPEEMAGQRVNCPSCQQSLTVPNRSTIPTESKPEVKDISFDCSKCGQHIVIDGTGAGRFVDCPKCGSILVVPNKPNPAPTINTPTTGTLDEKTPPAPSPEKTVTVYVDSTPQKYDCAVTGYAIFASGPRTQWYIDRGGHLGFDSGRRLSDSDMREFVEALKKNPQVPVIMPPGESRIVSPQSNTPAYSDDYLAGNPSAVKLTDYKVSGQSPMPTSTDTKWDGRFGNVISLIVVAILIIRFIITSTFLTRTDALYITEFIGVIGVVIISMVLLACAPRRVKRGIVILLTTVAILISPIVLSGILINCDVNPHILQKLWRQATNILDIDSLAGTIGLTGKWVKEGSYDKAVYLEFFSDKTLTFHTKETPIAGKWTVLSDGRIKYDLSLPLGATGTFLCDLEGQTLLIDVDGKKVRYVRM